ncbi:MAG: helix-turn-helix transcriptional regulator [Pseudodesulfovibrio sp.]|nr:helix-turn-helix transcriptional regulator [Pseudodesulfovibrio sp.]
MNIGERLKAVRGKTTQKDFAKSLGVALNTLGKYERGERTPNVNIALEVVRQCGVNLHWLLSGEGCMREGEIEQVELGSAPASLEAELSKERELTRELMAENRQLWKENGELKVKIGELNVQNVKLEGELDTAQTMAKEYYERLQARAAPEEDTPHEATRDCA